MVDALAARSYQAILDRLKEGLGPDRHALWFDRTRLIEFRRGRIRIGVPNDFYREWIMGHYRGELEKAAVEVLGAPIQFEAEIDPGLAEEHRRSVEAAIARETSPAVQESHRRDFGSFIVVNENRFAVETLQRLAQKRLEGSVRDGLEARFNPLVIAGPAGTGKSHLLEAFESACRSAGGRRVHSSDAITFSTTFTRAVKSKGMESFRRRIDGVDLLVIDELHRLKGKKATQRELLRMVQHLVDRGSQVVFATRHLPKDIRDFDTKFQSVLLSGMLVRVDPYSSASLAAIIRGRRRAGGGVFANAEVVQRVARSARGSVDELERRLRHASSLAAVLGQGLTSAFVEGHAQELDLGGPRVGADDVLIERVCAHYGVSRPELMSKRKLQSLTLPRGLIVVALRDLRKRTFKEIGRLLGGRSHTSVFLMHKRYQPIVLADPEMVALRDSVARAT